VAKEGGSSTESAVRVGPLAHSAIPGSSSTSSSVRLPPLGCRSSQHDSRFLVASLEEYEFGEYSVYTCKWLARHE